jgi:hypothetical protein
MVILAKEDNGTVMGAMHVRNSSNLNKKLRKICSDHFDVPEDTVEFSQFSTTAEIEESKEVSVTADEFTLNIILERIELY